LYDALCYKGSALMLDSLRQALGDERFFDGIKCYYDNNAYSIADTQGFIEDFSLGSTVNIEAIITPWLNGSVYWG